MIYADLEFFLKGGGERGAAFHDYFCSPFGPERRGCILKLTLFGKIFRRRGVNFCDRDIMDTDSWS